jgi:hypothetical protein
MHTLVRAGLDLANASVIGVSVLLVCFVLYCWFGFGLGNLVMDIQTIELYNRVCNVENEVLASLGYSQFATIPRLTVDCGKVLIEVSHDCHSNEDGCIALVERSLMWLERQLAISEEVVDGR